MERVTHTDVVNRVNSVNRAFRGLSVRAERRNGYTGLDLYDSHGCVRTLTTGTSREVWTFLSGMREALNMSNHA